MAHQEKELLSTVIIAQTLKVSITSVLLWSYSRLVQVRRNTFGISGTASSGLMSFSFSQQCQSTGRTVTRGMAKMKTKYTRGAHAPNGYGMQQQHPFSGPLSGTTLVSRYQKGKTNLDFAEARDSEWRWHQLGHMQICTLLQTDNHASTSPLLHAGCASCHPTNSVKALKGTKK